MKTGSRAVSTAERVERCGVDLMEAIHGRRAVRAYDGRPVSAEDVHVLLDAAVQAPSAMNLQPWAFVVVQRRELLERISERARERTLAELAPDGPWRELRAMLADPGHDVLHGAGTLIAICAQSGPWPANEDCCLAAQNLMLAAYGLGLGSCPIGLARGALNEPALRAEFSIPDDHSVVLPIVVGHPREHPAPTPRRQARLLAWK